jgi:hypothetical protein
MDLNAPQSIWKHQLRMAFPIPVYNKMYPPLTQYNTQILRVLHLPVFYPPVTKSPPIMK